MNTTDPNDQNSAPEERWSSTFSQLQSDAPPPPIDPTMFHSVRAKTLSAYLRTHNHRRIASHRFVRWATVVSAAAALICAVTWLAIDSATPAFGVQDVPRVMSQAKTLHVRAVRYIYQPDERFPGFERAVLCPMEWWIDLENDRSRLVSFLNMGTGKDWVTGKTETISSGTDKMDFNHRKNRVTFIRRSLIAEKLESRQIVRQTVDALGRDQLDQFAKVGRQDLNGRPYDIWERSQQLTQPYKKPDQPLPDVAVRCWVSPETGDLARVHQLVREDRDKPWKPEVLFDVIERDMPMPAELFAMKVPEGFTASNSLEQPQLSPLIGWRLGIAEAGDVQIAEHVGFTLEDGTVLLGWSLKSSEKTVVSSDAFKQLKPGDSLPKLPVAISDLTLLPQHFMSDNTRWYAGRHLAFTEKDGRLIEWAIYLPRDKSPTAPANPLYITWLTIDGQDAGVRRFNPTYCDRIADAEFDEFVIGAMKELSATNAAPEHVTLANVKALVQSLRDKIPATPPTTLPAKQ